MAFRPQVTIGEQGWCESGGETFVAVMQGIDLRYGDERLSRSWVA
jgi:hypothetical protein